MRREAVGFGQSRSAKQLPVLTMVSGYSRWLSALLIPSGAAEVISDGYGRTPGSGVSAVRVPVEACPGMTTLTDPAVVQTARRRYRTKPVVVHPAILVPLSAEDEQRALGALAELLAPLFMISQVDSCPRRKVATFP